jgi:putative ABC transport system substrate-binding protein
LITLDDALIQSHRAQIIGLALQRKLPVVGEFRASVDAGALMSYSADAGAMWHRAASFVDRILRGAEPSELPVELPTQFQLIINLKTARELGINVPAAILARADEVIE